MLYLSLNVNTFSPVRSKVQTAKSNTIHNVGRVAMSKERNSTKEIKKKPALSLKEKRAAKKDKKETKTGFITSDKK